MEMVKEEKYLIYNQDDGALLSEIPIEDLTQRLNDAMANLYKAKYFIAETLTRNAAMIIANALGYKLKVIGG